MTAVALTNVTSVAATLRMLNTSSINPSITWLAARPPCGGLAPAADELAR